MPIEDDTFDELVRAHQHMGNKTLAEHIKKGESYLNYLSRERKKHLEHIQELKTILALRIRIFVEEEEARRIMKEAMKKSQAEYKQKNNIK